VIYQRATDAAVAHQTANDWLFTTSIAASAVEYGLFAWLVLALRHTLAQEQQRAQHDALTGLLNRRAFAARVTTTLSRVRRRRRADARSGVLVYLDLDGFKAVNDTAGHEAGDTVLRIAADALRAAVRNGDVVARMGGDEFAVWLPGATAAEAKDVAERALAQLRESTRERGWDVGASIGIAAFASIPDDVDAAVRHADALMYDVKRSGRGRIHIGTVQATCTPAVADKPHDAHTRLDSPSTVVATAGRSSA